jgi:hypothetical protein
MMPAEEQVLKSDSKGRIQTPPQRRERLLDEFERSCYELNWRHIFDRIGVIAF